MPAAAVAPVSLRFFTCAYGAFVVESPLTLELKGIFCF